MQGCPGITPAYAGKSDEVCQIYPAGRDHPRVCGEKRHCRRKKEIRLGITPAYAGKRNFDEQIQKAG